MGTLKPQAASRHWARVGMMERVWHSAYRASSFTTLRQCMRSSVSRSPMPTRANVVDTTGRDTALPVINIAASTMQRRGFFSFFGKSSENVPAEVEFVPMLQSQNPHIRNLAEQYAQNGPGCGKCDGTPKRFSCPHSGWPTHCSEDCYSKDVDYQAVKDELRTVYLDMLDLHSKRKFPEFEFPGPPRHDWQRAELINWRTYLSDRHFKSRIGKKIGDARTDEDHELEAQSVRHISSLYTFPLTIAHATYWHNALGDPSKLDKKDEDGNLIPKRIIVLGARQEATLPPRVWLELNAIFPEAAFDIHHIGPDVPEKKHEETLEMNEGKMRITWTRARYQDVHEFVDVPDLYALFNSGVGYPHAQDEWTEALDIVFNESGFRPALFSSHNKEDSARDYAYLSRRQDCRYTSHPAENPFMSLKKDVAVNNIQYMINSNKYYAMVRGAPPDGLIWGSNLLEKIRNAAR